MMRGWSHLFVCDCAALHKIENVLIIAIFSRKTQILSPAPARHASAIQPAIRVGRQQHHLSADSTMTSSSGQQTRRTTDSKRDYE